MGRRKAPHGLALLACCSLPAPAKGWSPPPSLCEAFGGHGALFGSCGSLPEEVSATASVTPSLCGATDGCGFPADEDGMFIQVSSALLHGLRADEGHVGGHPAAARNSASAITPVVAPADIPPAANSTAEAPTDAIVHSDLIARTKAHAKRLDTLGLTADASSLGARRDEKDGVLHAVASGAAIDSAARREELKRLSANVSEVLHALALSASRATKAEQDVIRKLRVAASEAASRTQIAISSMRGLGAEEPDTKEALALMHDAKKNADAILRVAALADAGALHEDDARRVHSAARAAQVGEGASQQAGFSLLQATTFAAAVLSTLAAQMPVTMRYLMCMFVIAVCSTLNMLFMVPAYFSMEEDEDLELRKKKRRAMPLTWSELARSCRQERQESEAHIVALKAMLRG